MAIFEDQDLIYIGSFARFETNNNTGFNGSGITNASAGPVLGSYDFASGLRVVQGATYDTGSCGNNAYENNVAGQEAADITYTLGGSTVRSELDVIFVAQVEIFDENGASQGTTSMAVTQLTNGETFLAPTFASQPFFNNPVTINRIDILSLSNLNSNADVLPNPSINEGLVICFEASTQIATSEGLVEIQDIARGDKVITANKG